MNAETPPTHTGDMSDLRLGIPGFSYADLHDVARLPDLLAAFETELERADPQLHERYRAYHDGGGKQLKPTELSALLIELAGHVSAFLARLFGVEQELAQYRECTSATRSPPSMPFVPSWSSACREPARHRTTHRHCATR